jgi:DNA-binding IclR family transcriptional regulator
VADADPPPSWAFLTSHGVMLVEVTRTPEATVRELAERSSLTERQAHRVLNDLVDEGYVSRERVGRRNRYRVNESRPMRRASYAAHEVGELLRVLAND